MLDNCASVYLWEGVHDDWYVDRQLKQKQKAVYFHHIHLVLSMRDRSHLLIYLVNADAKAD
jgi:hypothetical protein